MYSSNWFWTKFGLDSEICTFNKKKKEATLTFWEEFIKWEFPKDYTDFSFVLHDSQLNNFLFQKSSLMYGEKLTGEVKNYSSALASPFKFR